jgi:hypothetical protein
MPIYEMTRDAIVPLSQTAFATQGLQERKDVQRLLRECVHVISPDTMVIAEEFGDWVDSNRRIDLLGLDKDGSLVVIELKRSEDGGHMELQAIRYAAMVSRMTFEQAVEAHRKYLVSRGTNGDPAESILSFLGSDKPQLSGAVRIVLASAEFSKEITSSVLWLNDQGLDITCVRLRPYAYGERVLLDVQQVIPLPEAAEFQIAIQQQARERRDANAAGRDFTKYWLKTRKGEFERLNKRHFVFEVVREAIRLGKTTEQIADAIPGRSFNRLFWTHLGKVDSDTFVQVAGDAADRFFGKPSELIYVSDKTYALTNQWGRRTEETVKAVLSILPSEHGIEYSAAADPNE